VTTTSSEKLWESVSPTFYELVRVRNLMVITILDGPCILSLDEAITHAGKLVSEHAPTLILPPFSKMQFSVSNFSNKLTNIYILETDRWDVFKTSDGEWNEEHIFPRSSCALDENETV
jgi:hypothetical protein